MKYMTVPAPARRLEGQWERRRLRGRERGWERREMGEWKWERKEERGRERRFWIATGGLSLEI